MSHFNLDTLAPPPRVELIVKYNGGQTVVGADTREAAERLAKFVAGDYPYTIEDAT